MFAEVVASHETHVTHGARKTFLAGVRPEVARQLVGTRELLLAPLPRALVGAFSRVGSHVSLEVGALDESFPAPCVRAHIALCPLLLFARR